MWSSSVYGMLETISLKCRDVGEIFTDSVTQAANIYLEDRSVLKRHILFVAWERDFCVLAYFTKILNCTSY